MAIFVPILAETLVDDRISIYISASIAQGNIQHELSVA